MPTCRSLARSSWLPVALAACAPLVPDPTAGSEAGSTSSATAGTSTTGPHVSSTTGVSITSGADTSGSDSSDSGVLFLGFPDFVCFHDGLGEGLTPRCTFECDVVAQDCPSDEKCMPWANDGSDVWNASRCSPILPEIVPNGGTCTVEGSVSSGIDDCALGSMCWGVDPLTLQGTCVGLCDPLRRPSTTCVEPAQCVPLNEGYVPLCLTPCNPLQGPPCPASDACRLVDDEGEFYCLPLTGGEVLGSSQHCEEASCLPSQVCVPTGLLAACEADRCCTDLCDLADPGADAQCAAIDPALACGALYEPGGAPAGLEMLGACTVPM